jgi:hypothetical protein
MFAKHLANRHETTPLGINNPSLQRCLETLHHFLSFVFALYLVWYCKLISICVGLILILNVFPAVRAVYCTCANNKPFNDCAVPTVYFINSQA